MNIAKLFEWFAPTGERSDSPLAAITVLLVSVVRVFAMHPCCQMLRQLHFHSHLITGDI